MPTGSTKAHRFPQRFLQEGRPLAAFLLAASVALLTALLASLALPQRADASSLRVSCEIYDTNRVDPIALSPHLHHQFGNTSTTNESTGDGLRDNKATSCPNAPYLTSAGWFPVEKNEPVAESILYYRAAGDQTVVHALPNGIELIARAQGVGYNCGATPLNAVAFQDTPPYGCTQNWATHVRFPACWNGTGLGAENTVYGMGGSRTNCPSSHPHRLVEVNFTITHKNFDGVVPNPLLVSAGVDEWHDYTHMHADYFFAAQDEVNRNVDLDGDGRVEQYDNDGDGRYEPWDADGDSEKALVDLCTIQAPQFLAYANARCRADGLLSAHVNQLHNYYGGLPVPTNRPATLRNPPSAPHPYPVS